MTNSIVRKNLHQAFADLIHDLQFPFNITATLPPDWSRESLEYEIRGWAARINRFYLGRHWAKPDLTKSHMDGIVFFERFPCWHAHMMLLPPVGASWLHFQLKAALFFRPHPWVEYRKFSPRPITCDGKMLVQRIKLTGKDFRRVGHYNSKEVERCVDGNENWKFIRDLSGRQVA